MVSEETVLILGAGASKPYGYPTALELREEIIYNLIRMLRSDADEKGKGTDFDTHPFIINVKKLIEVFKKSSTASIDLFLSRNKEFYDIGKQMITYLLGNYEIQSKFREDIKNRDQDWYFNLYETLTKEIVTPDEINNFSKNKISVITFNYDRSLEHFLHESLLNSFRSKSEDINQMMRDFNIIHVYGKLANLPWEMSDSGVEYGARYISDYYAEYSKNIKIIYDERESDKDKITELIKNARKVFFLGFGYSEENLEAIGFDSHILSKGQEIYGTAYKSTDAEIVKNVSRLRKSNIHMNIDSFCLENCDSKMLLRNYLF